MFCQSQRHLCVRNRDVEEKAINEERADVPAGYRMVHCTGKAREVCCYSRIKFCLSCQKAGRFADQRGSDKSE